MRAGKIRISADMTKTLIPSFMRHVLMFMFLFDINCSAFGLPTLVTTRRLAVVLMLMWGVLSGRIWKACKGFCSKKMMVSLALLQAALLVYSGLVLLGVGRGSGEHVFDSIIRFFLIGILGGIGFAAVYPSLESLLKSLVVVTVVQALVVLLFLAMPALQTAVDRFTGTLELNADLRRRGYLTGIACTTSKGTLKMTPALGACVYFMLKNPDRRGRWLLCFAFLAFTATLLARTGLVVAGVGIAMVLLFSGRKGAAYFLRFVGMLAVFGVIAVGAVYLLDLTDALMGLFARVVEMMEEGVNESFFDIYFEGSKRAVPELSLATIIGTGVTSGISGNGIEINVDGGFLRLYTALGLPMCIVFYAGTALLMLRPIRKCKDRTVKVLLWFMLIYILGIGEFKEYFIYEGYAMALYTAMVMLHDRDCLHHKQAKA